MKKSQYEAFERRLSDVEQRLDNIDSTTVIEIDGEYYPVSRVHADPSTPEAEEAMDAMDKAQSQDEKDIN